MTDGEPRSTTTKPHFSGPVPDFRTNLETHHGWILS